MERPFAQFPMHWNTKYEHRSDRFAGMRSTLPEILIFSLPHTHHFFLFRILIISRKCIKTRSFLLYFASHCSRNCTKWRSNFFFILHHTVLCFSSLKRFLLLSDIFISFSTFFYFYQLRKTTQLPLGYQSVRSVLSIVSYTPLFISYIMTFQFLFPPFLISFSLTSKKY